IETKFTGYLDLEALLPDKMASRGRIPIEFETSGLSIISMSAGFELIEKNDPSKFRFEGELTFNIDTDADEVVKAIQLWENKRRVGLEVSRGEDGVYRFRSGIIERTDEDRRFTLEISSKRLKLPGDFTREFLLPAKVNFVVTDVEVSTTADEMAVVITFSDDLISNEDYRGLIRTNPRVDLKLSVRGKTITASGNFERAATYQVEILAGLKSLWGTKTERSSIHEVEFPSMLPQINFVDKGLFVPSTNKKSIDFSSVNVRRAVITIKKVYENNLGFFIQENNFRGGGEYWWDDSYRDLYRVGDIIAVDTLEIGDVTDKWLKSRIDLSKITRGTDRGAYVIELSFGEEDILVGLPPEWPYWQKSSYFWDEGKKATAIIFTDLGLIAKNTGDKIGVWAVDLVSGAPVSDAAISLKSYTNQTLLSKTTDAQGYCEFDTSAGFYIEGVWRGHRTVLLFREMMLGTSLFDVGGATEPPDDIRAFIYTERGVFRPGDDFNLTAIFRNSEGTFPKNHPVELELFNPRGRKVSTRMIRESEDGWYNFPLATDENAPTGFWRAELTVGEKKFVHHVRIETVVPYRIRTNITTKPERLTPLDDKLIAEISANYLFGNPAVGLGAKVKLSIRPFELSLDTHKGFVFTNEMQKFEPITLPSRDVKLDSEGKAAVQWELPKVESVPSALTVEVSADVFERGGRAVPAEKKIPFEVYSRYVGIQPPDGRFVRVGREAKIGAVLIDSEGNTIAGAKLEYKIFRSRRFWWFDYESEEDFRRRFKSDATTELIKSGSVASGSVPVYFDWKPDGYGTAFIEVTDPSGGHVAGVFINARHWGAEPSGGDADLLIMKTDKEHYRPGETAKVIVQTPKEGRALLSVEAGRRLVHSRWSLLRAEETVFEVPITREMMPTAYATVTAIQPHENTANDLPMRLYGVVPLHIQAEDTQLELKISAPEKIEPGQKFTISLSSKDNSSYRYTIAVVDEGLLDLTRFKTPDPWNFFYRRVAYLVRTYDVFSHVVGASWGEIFKRFSIGGALADYDMMRSPVKARRFKPVSLFSGVGESDGRGNAKVEFIMPEYVGSVRVMAVASKGTRYGSAEKAIPVTAPLMVLPTLPRVLAPGDEIALPVTVFAMEDGVGKATIELSVDGPVEVVGDAKITLDMPSVDERDVLFRLKASPEIGVAKVKILASSRNFRIADETEIAVRPTNPWVHAFTGKAVSAGTSAKLRIPDDGIEGTNRARITVGKVRDLNMSARLEWLIRYPYGCIEQIVSAAFPQLYLAELTKLSDIQKKAIDNNVNATIEGLRKFQLPSGGFGYWPNAPQPNHWATNYAGHFMVEAKTRGYHVPKDMFDRWIDYEKRESRGDPDHILTQAYRLYILASAGEPQFGAMNLLRQNYIDEMDNASRWLLACAYLMRGSERTAREIVAQTGTEVRKYREFGGTFGSDIRDMAIVLEGLVRFGNETQAYRTFEDIAEALDSDRWLSTQETATCLRSAAIFVGEFAKKAEPLEGSVSLPDGRKIAIDKATPTLMVEIEEGFGKEITLEITSGKGFARLDWFGIPERDTLRSMRRNLALDVRWLDEDGSVISPVSLPQNKIFWGHFRVRNPSNINLEQVALVQVLPSGWEIENIRLSGENYPDWTRGYSLSREDYFDLRDDRAMWFFNLRGGQTLDFMLKLNTVTVGKFRLPPTQVEVMYDDRYQAREAGRGVEVLK
ncbi:MAG TPA: alpha-2-macroglobulin family protein, partial [candidate division Zixibacteria bacterium]|nr:alpha-2-macroglobulin family protein [candidate division Zixibacteria bacterium]